MVWGRRKEIKNDKGKGGQPRKEKRGAATALPLFKEPPSSALSLLLRSSSRCLVKFVEAVDWSGHSIHFRLVVLL